MQVLIEIFHYSENKVISGTGGSLGSLLGTVWILSLPVFIPSCLRLVPFLFSARVLTLR